MYKNIILIFIFNTIYLFAEKDTVFYDYRWEETVPKNAEYYRVISKKDKKFFVEDHYISGETQMRGFYISLEPEIKDGPFTFFDESGRMTEFGYYRNGIKDGKYEFYHKNGQVEFLEHWKNGKLDGKITAYQEDGTLVMEGQYKKGERYGKWKYYDYFGKLENERYYQRKINIIPAGLTFRFPNDEWYASENMEKEDKLKFSFKRTAIELNNEEFIQPLISVIIDNNDNDLSLSYYASTRVTSYNIKIIQDVTNMIKIKNSLAFLIEYKGKDGTKLKGYLIFIKNKKGIDQIYIETTKSTFEEVDQEFVSILKTISLM
jgi:antitoxin component YwqK of YwqJK toxin-antitoxin module